VAVLVRFAALQFFETMQFPDGCMAFGQIPLLMQQGFAALHQTRKHDLLFVGEKVDSANVLEVKPQQIRRTAAAAFTGSPCPSGLTGQELAVVKSNFRVPRR
jgi:hypothetical protein